jgi:hypothetical protein
MLPFLTKIRTFALWPQDFCISKDTEYQYVMGYPLGLLHFPLDSFKESIILPIGSVQKS